MSEDLMYSTLEEQVYWCNCVRTLPRLEGFSGTGKDKFGELIPYGTGAHSLRAFREAFEIVNPASVIEIGFNCGYAAAVFLSISDATLLSCDISMKDETLIGAEILTKQSDGRFTYYHRHSESFKTYTKQIAFDLCFVDGGHLKDDVMVDIDMCLLLKIPYLLFDDIKPEFGDVQEVIDTYGELELIKTWGNIALYKNIRV